MIHGSYKEIFSLNVKVVIGNAQFHIVVAGFLVSYLVMNNYELIGFL